MLTAIQVLLAVLIIFCVVFAIEYAKFGANWLVCRYTGGHIFVLKKRRNSIYNFCCKKCQLRTTKEGMMVYAVMHEKRLIPVNVEVKLLEDKV